MSSNQKSSISNRKSPAFAWTLLCLALFSIPGQDLPPDLLSFDKVAHLGLFAVLGVLWMRAMPREAWPWVLVGGIVFGIGTELYQGMLPWERKPDPYDALADGLGMVLGVGYWLWWERRREHREQLSDT
ncbi:MAG: VanZ family protein [Bacteroidota bacterium]